MTLYKNILINIAAHKFFADNEHQFAKSDCLQPMEPVSYLLVNNGGLTGVLFVSV